MGLLVAHKDYGFIFKMKMTEVSNPMQRKQKRPGMGSNSFDLKNIATHSEMRRTFPGDDYLRKLCNIEKALDELWLTQNMSELNCRVLAGQ